jgi:hypothetical protein
MRSFAVRNVNTLYITFGQIPDQLLYFAVHKEISFQEPPETMPLSAVQPALPVVSIGL